MIDIDERVVVDNSAIKIIDSWEVKKKEYSQVLDMIREKYPDHPVCKNRKDSSLKLEWASHNGLYKVGAFRSHTKDVDFEYPQKWYMKIIYALSGGFFWIFLK